MKRIVVYGKPSDLSALELELKKENVQYERDVKRGRGIEADAKHILEVLIAANTFAKVFDSWFKNRRKIFIFTCGKGMERIENPSAQDMENAAQRATAVYLSEPNSSQEQKP